MVSLAYAMGGQAQAGTQNPLAVFLPFVIIFVIFYFLLIRPQKLQQKRHQEMINKIQKNDKVITSGGIHGTVLKTKDTIIIIKVDDNSKLEVEKTSVSKILPQ